MLDKLKLHAPPTTLVVAVLAWLFGQKIGGAELQQIGQLVTCVVAGAFLPSAAQAAQPAVAAVKAKLPGSSNPTPPTQ